jgi:hypothetical protein
MSISQADFVIQKFGGQTAMARALGTSQGTVWGWSKRGFIPARQMANVMDAARALKIKLPIDTFTRRFG